MDKKRLIGVNAMFLGTGDCRGDAAPCLLFLPQSAVVQPFDQSQQHSRVAFLHIRHSYRSKNPAFFSAVR
jgi:hypothetical protein